MTVQEMIDEVCIFIVDNGLFDGAHHKQWVLDQVLRKLLKENYQEFINTGKAYGFDWDEGVAP